MRARASFCIQKGDLCARAEDCCTAVCTIATGKSVGVCGEPPSGSSFCSDGHEGTVCGDCNDCCSRLCAPYGPTGVKVCQPASGCHITGDFCRKDADCCGVEGTDLPGSGHVYCEKAADSDPRHLPQSDGLQSAGQRVSLQGLHVRLVLGARRLLRRSRRQGRRVRARPLGIPRCNGLGDACRKSGDTCASSEDCCDDVPCVPGESGLLHCYGTPPGGPNCVPSTGACTINGDCCPGTTCVRPIGRPREREVYRPAVAPAAWAAAAALMAAAARAAAAAWAVAAAWRQRRQPRLLRVRPDLRSNQRLLQRRAVQSGICRVPLG